MPIKTPFTGDALSLADAIDEEGYVRKGFFIGDAGVVYKLDHDADISRLLQSRKEQGKVESYKYR